MAAAHLMEEYALDAAELDVVGQSEWDNLRYPAPGDPDIRTVAALTGGQLLAAASGDEDPIGKRWGDKVVQGYTLVIARSGDPEQAQTIARELRQTGAERVDLLPH